MNSERIPLLRPHQGPVSRKSRKLFGPEKPFVRLRPADSVKPVFSYVVKGIKIKITAKFRASRRLSFEDTKRIMSPEMRPKSLGTFRNRPRTSRTFVLHAVVPAHTVPRKLFMSQSDAKSSIAHTGRM